MLVKPFTSAPQRWSLAQGADDVWTEYLCTANEEPEAWKKMDPNFTKAYDKGEIQGQGEDAAPAPAAPAAGRGGRGGRGAGRQ